ncbi:MAG: glycosyltransferase family 39 protein [Gemmatimonadales bacterium]
MTAEEAPLNRQSVGSGWIYPAVAAVAVAVYVGALANRFAVDDIPLIVQNPLVSSGSGLWRAFVTPYWPADLGGSLYRPLPVASWALDRLVDGAVWYHLVNLLWHAAVSIAVAALARRVAGEPTGLAAGLLFAVHPVHVEAVANVVGRAELMAGLFVVLAVHAALARQSVGWSAAAWGLGLLCKENAAVLPALVVWGWMVGLARPTRRRMATFVASWVVIGGTYTAIRWAVLHPYAEFHSLAPIFLGEPPAVVRWTAVAALADVARLLVFPLTLRVDYSPAERSAIPSPLNPWLAAGLACLILWGALLAFTWRRGRRIETYGLGWIGIAFLPVANLLFPVGFLLAERTLYLPSVGFALAAGAWLARLPRGVLRPTAAALVVLCAVRTGLRVPVWRDNTSVTLSILEDSPHSYVGPKRMISAYLDLHEPGKALAAARGAAAIYDRDPTIYDTGAVAAFAANEPLVADTMLAQLERMCRRCVGYYHRESATARRHGYLAAADSLLARARALDTP